MTSLQKNISLRSQPCLQPSCVIYVTASHAENICASVKRDVAELCHSSGTLQALVQLQPPGAGRQAELVASAQVGRAADKACCALAAVQTYHLRLLQQSLLEVGLRLCAVSLLPTHML